MLVGPMGAHRRFGIAHVMLVTASRHACEVSAASLEGICCVWAEPLLPNATENVAAHNGFMHGRRLMHIRWVLYRWHCALRPDETMCYHISHFLEARTLRRISIALQPCMAHDLIYAPMLVWRILPFFTPDNISFPFCKNCCWHFIDT